MVLTALGARHASSQADEAYARMDGDQCVIGNKFLERAISLAGGAVQTTSLRNKVANMEIRVKTQEFLLKVDETEELKTTDFAVREKSVKELAGGAKQLILTSSCERRDLQVALIYEVAPGDPFMRKRLRVGTAGAAAPLLNSVDVESFTTEAKCDLGGRGQPVFIADSLFVGLEYPAGINEVIDHRKAQPPGSGFSVALRHFPGRRVGETPLESKTAVLGVGPAGAVERAFAKYLAKIRIPPRTHVHYNSWYDIRQDKMSTEAFLETFQGFKKNLCEKYGVRLDAFVPDDGWQDRQSIWEINAKLFPKGFGELVAGLKAGGSSLGLWHPLTAVKGNLDIEWCRAHGYETDKAGSHLCLSAPRYNAQLRKVMTEHIRAYDISYFKHDFNSFSCDGEGHGHLPMPQYGFEANVDAYIEFLKLFKQINPKVFLNCTGGMWLSPWWLMYCDTVWRGASDTGYEKAYPFVNQRHQAITYVDSVLYDNFVKHRYQFPISALMVHGIVYGQLHMLGGKDEPLETWTDNAVWAVCLGLMMKELYITPRLLSDAHWDVLGKALRWAEANKDVLVDTQLIGGDPHVGDPIGYKHAIGDRTIVFVRNPSIRPQKITFDLAPPDGDATPRLIEIVYPYRKTLARDAHPVRPIAMELGPNETLAIEALPFAQVRRPVLEGCRYAVVSQSEKEYVFDVVAEGPTALLSCPGRLAEVRIDDVSQTLAGDHETSLALGAPKPSDRIRVEQISPEPPLRNRVRISLPPGGREGRFYLVCEKAASHVPLKRVTVNGKDAKAKTLEGDRWKTFIYTLERPENEVAWDIEVSARPRVPFGAKSFVISAYASAKTTLHTRRVRVRLAEPVGPLADFLPTPFAAQQAHFVQVQAPCEVRTVLPGEGPKMTPDELRRIQAARLHFAVFGANEEERYRHKAVTLNGVEVGLLPPNPRYRLDEWVERTMDIPRDKWNILAAENILTVSNCGGDCFKFRDVALAVQLPDGTWVESNRDVGIYCSSPGWLYEEGVKFVQNRSPEIRLRLPVENKR